MPRPLRITISNLPFHVLDRGNNRQTIFQEEDDFIYFLKLLKRYKKELKFKLYHLCLMPNHIHLVIEPTITGSLPKIMMRLTLAYSSYFNKKHGRVGHVWQGRYKSSLLDKEGYFIWCGLYVELNPVRAKLVEKPQDWRWSSYNFYAFGKGGPLIEELIDTDPYYFQLADNPEERQERYRKNIEGVMKEDFLRNIRQQLDEGVFGKQNFVQEMKEKFQIRSLKSRGRPKRAEK
ncbi:MAG: transposase [Candidatus Nealsonbacteria bacterium CG_4_10_14_0_2_um_filter_38_17]|uniref:Transposase n=2 Tax=Candidatus Nealsoniibacteriota TaxID=1817911 RepID=A0A2M7UYD8_9BACT|nr:MAG: transposase [Candidatus Nealsonbacteria bacterium CG23_combo_of_CG06-09_8_20_14_all_38_19]PIZ88996.1 MAG: transposase [Candidatus Nealsonbacteria bacterium CG_4_10_14_0_2_um_filter_38_17]